jgi:hypothetical protein
MIDPQKFADWQLELATEFTQYVVDHPEVDELLPETFHICFEVAGQAEYSQHSLALARLSRQREGGSVVVVRVKGLAPRGSRLIDPVIDCTAAVA